jgi:hypothetical protein
LRFAATHRSYVPTPPGGNDKAQAIPATTSVVEEPRRKTRQAAGKSGAGRAGQFAPIALVF